MSSRKAIVVELEPLWTDRENCLMVEVGPVDEDTVKQAEHHRFDQLPVLDNEGQLCGLVATSDLRLLMVSGQPLVSDSPSLQMFTVPARTELFSFLNALNKHRAVVIRDRILSNDAGKGWFALVTVSDLNRHYFRTLLYQPLIELELALAELVDLYFEDPWDWITTTSERSRISNVGQWELEKRASVDTHPVTACTLTDLVTVVGKTPGIRKNLGYTSKGKYDDFTGRFAGLRNQVMHPVRPLILQPNEVGDLSENLERMSTLFRQVDKLRAELRETVDRGVRYLP